jgi:hypothetical protein
MVVERLLGLRRDPGPVVRETERVFQDEVSDAVRVHQREAGRRHATGRVAEDGDLPDTEVIEQSCGVGRQ